MPQTARRAAATAAAAQAAAATAAQAHAAAAAAALPPATTGGATSTWTADGGEGSSSSLPHPTYGGRASASSRAARSADGGMGGGGAAAGAATAAVADFVAYAGLPFAPAAPGAGMDVDLFLRLRARVKAVVAGAPDKHLGVKDDAVALLAAAVEVRVKTLLEATARRRAAAAGDASNTGTEADVFRAALAPGHLRDAALRNRRLLGRNAGVDLERLVLAIR